MFPSRTNWLVNDGEVNGSSMRITLSASVAPLTQPELSRNVPTSVGPVSYMCAGWSVKAWELKPADWEGLYISDENAPPLYHALFGMIHSREPPNMPLTPKLNMLPVR